jgi:hypothetical protein
MHLPAEMLSGRHSQPTRFNVVIFYEDFGTGVRAKKGLDYVAEELGNDLEFRHSMWRLDVLQEPKLDPMAAPALAEADLLLISLSAVTDGFQLKSVRCSMSDWRKQQITSALWWRCSKARPLCFGVRCTLAWRILRGSIASTFSSRRSAIQEIAGSLR